MQLKENKNKFYVKKKKNKSLVKHSFRAMCVH